MKKLVIGSDSSQGRSGDGSRNQQAALCLRPTSALGRLAQPHFSLSNTSGFWELYFHSRYAIVPQNQGLFYIAWLLTNPPVLPISATDLAANVFARFGEHPDFRHTTPWISLHQDRPAVLNTLSHKERALEAILDSEDEVEPVKEEALQELTLIYNLQRTWFTEIAASADQTSRIIQNGLRLLLASLSTAVDTRGNPHLVLRGFARHLLLYLFIPSVRASTPLPRFTYHPPQGIAWTPTP